MNHPGKVRLPPLPALSVASRAVSLVGKQTEFWVEFFEHTDLRAAQARW